MEPSCQVNLEVNWYLLNLLQPLLQRIHGILLLFQLSSRAMSWAANAEGSMGVISFGSLCVRCRVNNTRGRTL